MIQPPNRLAKILDAEDAAPIESLLRNAEARVEALEPVFAASLFPQVSALAQLCRRPDAALQADARAIRHATLSVVETAAVTRRHDMVPVALGICDLLDRWIFVREWRPRLVRAQAEGLYALASATGLSAADRATLTADLLRIRCEDRTPGCRAPAQDEARSLQRSGSAA